MIFIVTWIFALIPFSSRAWLTLVIGIAGSIPSIYLFREGTKKIKIRIQTRSIEIYHRKELHHSIQAPDVQAITYRISELISDSGTTVLRELKFLKKDGKLVELNIQSAFKTRFIILDVVAKRVEKWCKENNIAFSITITLPRMYENASENARIKEVDKLLKITSPPQVDPRVWRRRISIFLIFTITVCVGGVACFIPSISRQSLPVPNEVFSMLGLMLFIVGFFCGFKIFDEMFHNKPVSGKGAMMGIMMRDRPRWDEIGRQGTLTGVIWTMTTSRIVFKDKE